MKRWLLPVSIIFLGLMFLSSSWAQVSVPTTIEGREEGSTLGFGRVMNFVGAGITATFSAGTFTVTVAEIAAPHVVAKDNNASQTVVTNTWTTITFDSEDYDTNTMHSTSSNTSRLVGTIAGIYIVSGNVIWDTNTTNERRLRILANGTSIVYGAIDARPAVGVTNLYQFVTGQILLSASQYVELQVWQNSGTDRTISRDAGIAPYFVMTRVGG